VQQEDLAQGNRLAAPAVAEGKMNAVLVLAHNVRVGEIEGGGHVVTKPQHGGAGYYVRLRLEANAGQVLAEHTVPSAVEGRRQRCLSVRPRRREDERPTINFDCGRVKRQITPLPKAEQRRNSPEPLLRADSRAGNLHPAGVRIDGEPSSSLNPEPEASLLVRIEAGFERPSG